MNDDPNLPSPDEGDDPVLAAAGERLRNQSPSISPTAVQVAVLQRRSRRLGIACAASVVVVALVAALAFRDRGSNDDERVADRPGAPTADEVDTLLASLDAQPVDPTRVKLLSTVSTFADCDALVGDLRRVGAQHVGSQGFGGFGFQMVGYGVTTEANAAGLDRAAADGAASYAPAATVPGGETLGTNVQVVGVDELDHVKAVGTLIYDLDRNANLRITDINRKEVLATVDVTPTGDSDDAERFDTGGVPSVSQILVTGTRVVVFGSETEESEPVEGDPSATRSSTSYMTVTFVDASDPEAPEITDRVRVEGSLVSARLVGGEVRMVTNANMADLGFVMPTTPNSIAKALEQNRRSVASSTAADWIPDWQRRGDDPQPLVPCGRVHVPDTFSGVSMTSMVTFPAGSDSFEPAGTSILAPATTLYAGLEKVAISSEVWVDPIDRGRLEFEDWQTAIHEFSFNDDEAPGYEGSGIVDGSTIGQFAFGEIGGSLGVVTTEGTPWSQDLTVGVDMTVLTPDGDGGLTETAKVDDLSNGKGSVTAVRFIEGRVLISTGFFGREVYVIDVSDPAQPRRAGTVSMGGNVGYFHPLADQQALVISARSETVGEGDNRRSKSWVQAKLLDVSDADAPAIVGEWETPWASDSVGHDHHAFTYWPSRNLAMWGIQNTDWNYRGMPPTNHAIVLGTDGAVNEVAMPVANKPNEVASPCPTVDVPADMRNDYMGAGDVLVHCEQTTRAIEWPRYECHPIANSTMIRYGVEDADGSYFMCSPAPPPSVSRVLVVDGTPVLYTDQTLETLDPETFESTSITYHRSNNSFGYY